MDCHFFKNNFYLPADVPPLALMMNSEIFVNSRQLKVSLVVLCVIGQMCKMRDICMLFFDSFDSVLCLLNMAVRYDYQLD